MGSGSKVVLAILLVILLVLFGGQLIPRLIISPYAPMSLTADSREFVHAALIAANDLTGNPLESAMQTGLQVRSLQKTSNATGCGMIRDSAYPGHYTAVIRAHTWFGIPYAEISVDCDGATIRRSPWLLLAR